MKARVSRLYIVYDCHRVEPNIISVQITIRKTNQCPHSILGQVGIHSVLCFPHVVRSQDNLDRTNYVSVL